MTRARNAAPPPGRPRMPAGTLALPALLVAALLVPGPAGALEIGAWGALAGVGGWTQDFEYEGDQLFDPSTLLPAFTGGGYLDLGLGVAIPRVEVLYQARGSKDEVPRFDETGQEVGTATVELRGHYLSVPVSLKLQKTGVDTTPYLTIGLGAEFLLGSSGTSESETLFDRFRTVTLGGHIATGLEFSKLGIQARFYRDLTNSYQPVEGATLEKVHNQGFTFLLTFKLGPG